MWPDEVKADESDRDALAGGDRLGEDWERDVDDTQSAGAGGTVLAIEASRGDDDGDMSRASDEGEAIRAEEDEMGPEGGLQEEWDMMTTDEKVRGPAFGQYYRRVSAGLFLMWAERWYISHILRRKLNSFTVEMWNRVVRVDMIFP